MMPSIYQRALGADFDKLHPQIQERFGFTSHDGLASIGTGVMDEIWRGRLPAPAIATPMSYEWNGRQYVVIYSGGYSTLGTEYSDQVIAYALPD